MFPLLLLLIISPSKATRFIVDGEKGEDTNNGHNPSHAFKTIQRCVEELANPGDECQVREGRYHEVVTINGLRGTKDKPIVITGYKEERPIWDGTIPIQPKEWKKEGNVCSATINEDIFSLLLDDELMTAARWPNALWTDKTVFDNSFWGKCPESTRGTIVDDGTAGLAESGINATGAMAVLNIGSFNTYVSPVLKHRPGNNSFTYNDDFGDIHWTPRHNQYYLEASFELLDAPGEWFYDSESKVLYFIPPSGDCPDPSSTSLRGRTIDYGLIMTNTTGVTITNMVFIAANIHAYSVDHAESHIDHIALDSLKFLFPSSSHRMLGSTEYPPWTKLMAYAKMQHGGKVCGRIEVVNCTIEGGEGIALEYNGEDCYIQNNLFKYNDWVGYDHGNGGTVLGHSEGDEFSQNTLSYNGRSAGIRLGNRANILMNNVEGQCHGKIQNDGAGIQVQTKPQDGVKISHNWVHDSPKGAIRFDGGGHQLGYNGYQGYNVVWNVGGMMVKGDNHTVEKNLALDRYNDDGKCSLCVIYRLRHEPQIQNNHTVVINNGATQADGGTNVEDGGRWPMAGEVVENNYNKKDINIHLIGPDIFDFRPIAGGGLTQGDEIIGPYIPGRHSFAYWIPGRKLYKTSFPIPPSGSTVPKFRDVVMFLGGFKAYTHHFYLGLEQQGVEEAGIDDEEFQYTVDRGNMLELPELKGNTMYYWRVDAQVGEDVYKGDTWKFYTENS